MQPDVQHGPFNGGKGSPEQSIAEFQNLCTLSQLLNNSILVLLTSFTRLLKIILTEFNSSVNNQLLFAYSFKYTLTVFRFKQILMMLIRSALYALY